MFLVDMAHMVAAHANKGEKTFFSPHKGRVAAVTDSNITAANNWKQCTSHSVRSTAGDE